AAGLIQHAWRTFLQQRDIQRKEQAAGIIQRVWKTFLRRKEIKRNESAASLIQRTWRDFALRMREIRRMETGRKRKISGDKKAEPPVKRLHTDNVWWANGIDDFLNIKFLGQGGFGKVFQVANRNSSEDYAMKLVKRKEGKKEVAMLAQCRGTGFVTNICGLICVKGFLGIIMEFCSNGNLETQLSAVRKFSENVCRDLKLENLLLEEDGHLKIGDFGLAKAVKEQTTTGICGTPRYMAPEMLDSKPYDTSVDWWSMGVILYRLLVGEYPFDCDDEDDLDSSEEEKQIVAEILHSPVYYPDHLSTQAEDCITQVLDNNTYVASRLYATGKRGIAYCLPYHC
ncbi:unnamed protein product, partial [Porites lobata]